MVNHPSEQRPDEPANDTAKPDTYAGLYVDTHQPRVRVVLGALLGALAIAHALGVEIPAWLTVPLQAVLGEYALEVFGLLGVAEAARGAVRARRIRDPHRFGDEGRAAQALRRRLSDTRPR